MNKIVLSLLAVALFGQTISAQTTAMNFSGVDCSGANVNLFNDLDAGKAVVLFYYMPSCGSCPPEATKIQTMANAINVNYPGMVKGYAFPFQNSTTCSYSASWVVNNSLPLFQAMDSGATQVAYYGGFGMPTVVLLGGPGHAKLWGTQNFVTADTTTMHDLIIAMLTANINENATELTALNVYPNPANDMLNVNFTLANAGEVSIELLDLSGKLITSISKEQMELGAMQKQLNVAEIVSGSYLLNISVNGTTKMEKVNIIH
jgi:hypothetical protein